MDEYNLDAWWPKPLTKPQVHLMAEFATGAKAAQGDMILHRADGSRVPYDRRTFRALAARRYIEVEPSCKYWTIAVWLMTKIELERTKDLSCP